jgi:acyl-CoA thioesterase I
MKHSLVRISFILGISFFFLSFIVSCNGVPPEKRGHKKILVLGDSLTEGAGLPAGQVFPAVLERLIREKGYPEVSITADGENGALAQSGPSRFARRVGEGYDILILELGANDGLRGMDLGALKKELASVISEAQKANIKVLLACTRIPPLNGTQYKADFRETYEDLAKQYKCALVPSLLKDVAADPALNLPDGMHPNEKGHEMVARIVLKYLETML